MVELEPELLKRTELYRRSIFVPRTGSAYQVLSADAPTKHGKNSHAQPNRELFDVLKTSTGARRQPLMLMFTTAGYDRHSVCWEEHEYPLKVRDQVIHDDIYLLSFIRTINKMTGVISRFGRWLIPAWTSPLSSGISKTNATGRRRVRLCPKA